MPTPLGTLRIEKRSRTFDPVNSNIVAYDQPLSGAEFTLYTLNGLEVAKAISDAEGIAEFKDIRVGDYIVRETGVPLDHYEPARRMRTPDNGQTIGLGNETGLYL